MNVWKVVFATFMPAVSGWADEQSLQVCFLTSTGTGGCQEALRGRAEVKLAEIKRLDEEEVLTHDVLVVGATALADPHQHYRAQDLRVVWRGAGVAPQLLWMHVYPPFGITNALCLNGGPGGACFTFNQLWKPILYAKNLHYTRGPEGLGSPLHFSFNAP